MSGRSAALTPRQREIVLLLAEGLVPKQIAARLGIAWSTVRQHCHAAYGRLGVVNAAQAVRIVAPLHHEELERELHVLRGELTSLRMLNRAFDAYLAGDWDAAGALHKCAQLVLAEHGIEAREGSSHHEACDRILKTMGRGILRQLRSRSAAGATMSPE